MTQIPVYINCRDRVTHLKPLIEWFEKAGHERIVLLDNASTYPPLLDYLAATPHQVVRLVENLGSRAIWKAGLVPDEWFVYTDPDLLPIDDCPLDAVHHLKEVCERHDFRKAGIGLFLDDLPASAPDQTWERHLVSATRELEPGVFDSLVDTTLAVYRPHQPFGLTALRTGFPYQARHLSWYKASVPDEEDRYYLERAIRGPLGSSWAQSLYS